MGRQKHDSVESMFTSEEWDKIRAALAANPELKHQLLYGSWDDLEVIVDSSNPPVEDEPESRV